MSFELEEIEAGALWRIGLHRDGAFDDPVPEITNVYVSRASDGALGLVNVGHPTQTDALRAALRELEIDVSRVERIAYTSWSIHALGGAMGFPRADHLVVTPDLHRPRHYEDWLTHERASLERFIRHVAQRFDVSATEVDVERYLPPATNHLDFLPVRDGLRIAVGGMKLDVLTTSGFDDGHAFFRDQTGRLFSGEVAFDGLPLRCTDADGYLSALDRATNTAPALVLPNHDRLQQRGEWALKRATRFASNFLSSASLALKGGRTLADVVERDRGFEPENVLEFALFMRQYKPFLDALVNDRAIDARGAGLDIVYGADS